MANLDTVNYILVLREDFEYQWEEVAAKLNEREMLTPQGKQWTSANVQMLVHRLKAKGIIRTNKKGALICVNK